MASQIPKRNESMKIREIQPHLLIPKIRSTKHKNKIYKIIIIKGFPGLWGHNNLLDWMDSEKFDVSIIDFGLQIRNINFYTNKLAKIVTKNYDDKKIILIGFSMGGLIATRFAQDNNWKNVEKVLTFATPFKGSTKAEKHKYIPAAFDMSPNSMLLSEIYKKKVPKNKMVTVSGLTDDLVNVKGTSLPNSKHITLKVHGHRNAQVFKNIKSVLQKELVKYKE